jgi:uracil-DNA glycosylase
MNLKWAISLLEITVGNQKMIKVAIIGDEPSTKNVHRDLAFVGAKCFNTVVEWIKALDPDYYVCLNSNTPTDLDKVHVLAQQGFKLIALGEKASKRLGSLPHFKLPHPSGLNRQLNDKRRLALDLLACENYVWDLYE